MTAVRAYAETGDCLLNTAGEAEADVDTISRLHKTGVKLHYEPGRNRLRCYAQVRRSRTASPEQYLVEYETDDRGTADPFESFDPTVTEALEGWTILSDESPVYGALSRGRTDSPDATGPGASRDIHAILTGLHDHGEPVDLVATDREAAAGLARYLHHHDEFGDWSIAVSPGGRTARVVADTDVVIRPGGPHTGLTQDTIDRFEAIRDGESATVTSHEGADVEELLEQVDDDDPERAVTAAERLLDVAEDADAKGKAIDRLGRVATSRPDLIDRAVVDEVRDLRMDAAVGSSAEMACQRFRRNDLL